MTRVPKARRRYEVLYKAAHAEYQIVVENPDGVSHGVRRLEVDGVDPIGSDLSIVADGTTHRVCVVLGSPR